MTEPRRVVPGTVSMVTMRCVQRYFKLAPSEKVNEAFEYLLAYASTKYGVGLLGVDVQSNHAHLIVVDHEGQLPDMLQEMNMLLARGLNKVRGESGTFFDRNNIDIKDIEDDGALFVALGYTAANPVAAGCVEYGKLWPGFRSVPKDMGRPGREVRRPPWLFLNKHGEYRGHLPEAAILRFELPPGFPPEARGQVVYVAEMAVHLAEERARRKNAEKGVKYLGRARCWNADTNLRGTQSEDSGPGSGPDAVMATDPQTKELAQIEREVYLDAYREALGAWQHGEHAVIFPYGAWKVVRHHAAIVAIPPPDFRR